MTIEIQPLRDRRYRVYAGDRFIAGYTLGEYRPYVYPLCTPSGVPLTEEAPADHPHHQSLWLGQDEVDGVNFWLNEPGCGRVVGEGFSATVESTSVGSSALFRHDLSWRGPDGVVHLVERRTTAITPTKSAVVVDVRSQRRPAMREVELGATKEAGLGIRVHDVLDEDDGGGLRSSSGARGERAIFDSDADWVDYRASVAGRGVGIAVFPNPRNPRHPWFVRSYGLILLNHHRLHSQLLRRGDELDLSWRVAAYDGPAAASEITTMYHNYVDAEVSGVAG